VPGKNNEITLLLWINNFDFVSILCIVSIVACYCRWYAFRLKGRKGTSNIEKQWQIHMKNKIIEVSAKALIRITSAWLAITYTICSYTSFVAIYTPHVRTQYHPTHLKIWTL